METNAKGHAGIMAGGACDRRLWAAVQQELTWLSAWPSWASSELPAGKPRPSEQRKRVSVRDQQGEKILLVLKYTPVSSSLMDSVLHYTKWGQNWDADGSGNLDIRALGGPLAEPHVCMSTTKLIAVVLVGGRCTAYQLVGVYSAWWRI